MIQPLFILLAALVLTSPDLTAGGTIPQRFALNSNGCTGQNATPQLQWSGVPSGTKSLALTLFDPDAPTGHGWTHWVVAHIPPTARSSKKFASDGAVQGTNDFGSAGYGGPCPPPGDAPHHYIFTLYALDNEPNVGSSVTYDALRSAIKGHVLATATFTARYGR